MGREGAGEVAIQSCPGCRESQRGFLLALVESRLQSPRGAPTLSLTFLQPLLPLPMAALAQDILKGSLVSLGVASPELTQMCAFSP